MLWERVPVEHSGIVRAYVIDTLVGLVYSSMARNNQITWVLLIDNMLVMSSLLLESLGPVYPLVRPTSKYGYAGQVAVMSDQQERIRFSEVNKLISYTITSRLD